MSDTLPTLEGTRTLIGDLLIAQDASGAMGNLTVEGPITCDSISAESLPGTVYTATIEGNGSSALFTFAHNLNSLSPGVTITDNEGNVCLIDVTFPTNNSIRIQFPEPPALGTVFNVTIRK